MHKRFAAIGAVENEFNCLFKWYAFAFWAAAIVEVMVLFVLQPDIKFFKNSCVFDLK